jgi:hypothetical protein
MGQRRFFAGMIGAVVGLAGRLGGRGRSTKPTTHIPAHERWREPNLPGMGRNGSNRRPYRWFQMRQARSKMARGRRRRNRHQKQSQN